MKIKNIFFALLLLLSSQGILSAQADQEIEDLLGKGKLITVANGYFSVVQNQFPEEATRMGIETPNNKIDGRNYEADAVRKHYLDRTKKQLFQIAYKKLSTTNQIDYDLLKGRLMMDYKDLGKKRYTRSALYYANALDSVYDIMLKRYAFRSVQVQEIEGRIKSIPELFESGVKALKNVPEADVQLALNKIYNAYTNTNDIITFSQKAIGPNELEDIENMLAEERKAMRTFFDHIKTLNEGGKAKVEYALGNGEYTFLLRNKYLITSNTKKLSAEVKKNLDKHQKILTDTMQPMVQAILDKDQADSKTKRKAVTTPASYKGLAARHRAHPSYSNLLMTIAETIHTANMSMKGFLPEAEIKVNVNHMPGYIKAYHPAMLFVPPYGVQTNLTGNLFIATPQNTPVGKKMEDHLAKYFNYSRIKILAAEQVIPGKQMYFSYSTETSSIRRALGSEALVTGWGMYARQLAKEAKFLSTDADMLFLAWDDYVAAVRAHIDLQFHTKSLNYEEALALFLSFDIPEEDAQFYMNDIVRNPGEALAAFLSYEKFKQLRDKYQKSLGEKFNQAVFNNHIFAIGKVPYERLDKELERRYKKDGGVFVSEIDNII
ncbi:protein of unknown function (DUF885) [Parelusimicrobium proximum]|uniref:DUF885 family protein n=1 Tax=Parelusimicrobium proximum TaxID=3228953 RepID=UPI003D17679E